MGLREEWGLAIDDSMALWEFRGLTPYVRADLVPARCGATTRPARTPRNPEDPKRELNNLFVGSGTVRRLSTANVQVI